ncbi:MAG: hypothetical protein U9Q80_03255 [Bacillota bacterium]|nr:hypothetical protein [Bacillota bacterium]
MFIGRKNELLYVFKRCFTDGLRQIATIKKNIKLITLEELFNVDD